MAVEKITLNLDGKKIALTEKQFEELKEDMRELDRQYPYTYLYMDKWYTKPLITSGNSAVPNANLNYDFSGGILSMSYETI